MNNFKYSYAKKYHYMLKYFVMALPLLILLCFYLFSRTSSDLGDLYNYVDNWVYDFKDLTINSWYTDLINVFGFDGIDNTQNYLFILIYYPLYILWIYVFDLILDVISLIFKLVHKGLNKVVKDYD